MPNTSEQKETAVWQPLPYLLSTGHKAFVRVQDERGHTAHFTHWSCKRLDEDAATEVSASTVNQMAPESLSSGVVQPPHQQPGGASSDQDDTTPFATANEALYRQAYERGIEEGRRLQAAEQEAHIEALVEQRRSADQQRAVQLLGDIESGIAALGAQPERLHEPLKRLALHIAEELTLAELRLCTRAIEQLIQRCLDVLDAPVGSKVLIELNPQDLALLQSRAQERLEGLWQLQAQPDFMPGSVRVSADDASVTDLVEHRLASMARALLQDLQPWRSQSGFDPQRDRSRLAQAPLQEVTPRRFEAIEESNATAHALHEAEPDNGH